jgi:hypothetical protein
MVEWKRIGKLKGGLEGKEWWIAMLSELDERNSPLVDRLAWSKARAGERMPKRDFLIRLSHDTA